jgi:hypothetical protein
MNNSAKAKKQAKHALESGHRAALLMQAYYDGRGRWEAAHEAELLAPDQPAYSQHLSDSADRGPQSEADFFAESGFTESDAIAWRERHQDLGQESEAEAVLRVCGDVPDDLLDPRLSQEGL